MGMIILSSGVVSAPGMGTEYSRLGRLRPQVNLGVASCLPGLRPPTITPGLGWLSLTELVPAVCWWSQNQWVGAGRPDDVCEAISVGSVRQGVEVLSHKAYSVSPGSWPEFLPC